MNIAIIFAGGRGQRLNDSEDSTPKQFLKINNVPILIHTLLHFQNHSDIDKIYIAILSEYKQYTKELVSTYSITKVCSVVEGGSSAQESIYNALIAAQKENPDDSVVLIHDGVRPIITSDVITRNIQCTKERGNAITCTPCYETILISADTKSPRDVPLRCETFAAQAPQSFILGDIVRAHKIVRDKESGYKNLVDSCTLFHSLGYKTHLVEGNFGNIKITTPEDMYILKGILSYKKDFINKECKNDV